MDGGQIAIDWVHNDDSPHSVEVRPTVLVLPGLTGMVSFLLGLINTKWKASSDTVYCLPLEPNEAAVTGDAACRSLLGVNYIIGNNVNHRSHISTHSTLAPCLLPIGMN